MPQETNNCNDPSAGAQQTKTGNRFMKLYKAWEITSEMGAIDDCAHVLKQMVAIVEKNMQGKLIFWYSLRVLVTEACTAGLNIPLIDDLSHSYGDVGLSRIRHMLDEVYKKIIVIEYYRKESRPSLQNRGPEAFNRLLVIYETLNPVFDEWETSDKPLWDGLLERGIFAPAGSHPQSRE